jgi:hypothetical protein
VRVEGESFADLPLPHRDERYGVDEAQPPAPPGVWDEQQVRTITDLVMTTLAGAEG